MKLFTEAITTTLPPLYSQESVPDPLVRLKYFCPWGAGTWWLTEGSAMMADGRELPLADLTVDPETDPSVEDVIFFGLCKITDAELGNVSLRELQSVKGPFGLKIERDLHFTPTPLSVIQAKEARF